jgi:hypothetical protein
MNRLWRNHSIEWIAIVLCLAAAALFSMLDGIAFQIRPIYGAF